MKVGFVFPLLVLGVACNTPTSMAHSRGTFTITGSMATARSGHTATLLNNGKILIACLSGTAASAQESECDPSRTKSLGA
jgi:hypothetical protein